MRDDGDFFKDLRSEIANGQQRRTTYVLTKLAFVVGIFGIGGMKLTSLPEAPLLYMTTLVVFVFDLYILGEDYGIKRAGRYFLKNPRVPTEERRWERIAKANRDPVSGVAGLLSSAFVVCAAAAALWNVENKKEFYLIWCTISVLVLLFSWVYGQVLVNKLSKLEKHLADEFGDKSLMPNQVLVTTRYHARCSDNIRERIWIMENHKIEPHKITKPIQLMAVWFVALFLIDSILLSAAKFIKDPWWIPPLLVISAIIFVPFFVGGVFLMQTVFRKELQEDQFYSEWLNAKASQGQTTKETAAAVVENSKSKPRSLMEHMILNTLWTKQVNKWPDLSAFFTFSMGFPTASENQAFKEACAKLIGEGLIAEAQNGQYLLTINGFDYCKKHFKEFPKEQWWPEEQINKDNLRKVIEIDS